MTDGDQFSATNLNALLTQAATLANTLTEDQVTGLVPEQLPKTVDARTLGYGQALAQASADATETYTTFQADSGGGSTLPFDYQRFGTQAPNAPYGAPGANDDGWRILAKANSTTDAARAVLDPALDMTTVAAVRFTAQCDLRDGLTTGSHKHRNAVLLGFGVEDGSGNKYVFYQSVIWFSIQATERGPISAWFYYTPDLHQAEAEAEGVDMTDIVAAYAVISTRERIDEDNQHFDPEIAAFSFFVLPLYGGSL